MPSIKPTTKENKANPSTRDKRGWLIPAVAVFLSLLLLWTNSSLNKAIAEIVPINDDGDNKDMLAKNGNFQRILVDDSPFHFGGCMIFKDGNTMLPEWLAYHYQVMPLRRLVIGVDPFNLTGVDHIVDKYRSIGMNITVLLEEDYVFPGEQPTRSKILSNISDRYEAHIQRQNALFTKCSEILRAENYTWTIFIDSDEYVTFNRYHSHNERMFAECRHEKDVSRCVEDLKTSLTFNLTHPRATLPFVGDMTIARFMHENNDTLWKDYFRFGCMVLPRVHFGFGGEAFNHELDVPSQLGVPSGFDPRDFMTLLTRFHQDMGPIRPGKTITNLQAMDPFTVVNPHLVCPLRKDRAQTMYWDVHSRDSSRRVFPYQSKAIFRVNHYLGRMKNFQGIGLVNQEGKQQQQAMHNETYWDKDGDILARERTNGPNQDVQGWLQAFVNHVGPDVAYDLTVRLREWAYETDQEAIAAATENQEKQKMS